jgi:hypothetical protein
MFSPLTSVYPINADLVNRSLIPGGYLQAQNRLVNSGLDCNQKLPQRIVFEWVLIPCILRLQRKVVPLSVIPATGKRHGPRFRTAK